MFGVLLVNILIIDAEIKMCRFKFSVTFYCDSHPYQRFPRDENRSNSFTGVRPLVVPLDRTLRLLSPRLPLHWECISRRYKRLPCEEPFMAPETESCTCSGTRGYFGWKIMYRVCAGRPNSAGQSQVLRLLLFFLRLCYSGQEESTKTLNSGWYAFFAQQSIAPRQTPDSVSNVPNFPSGAGRASISIYSRSCRVRNVIHGTVGTRVGCGFRYYGIKKANLLVACARPDVKFSPTLKSWSQNANIWSQSGALWWPTSHYAPCESVGLSNAPVRT